MEKNKLAIPVSILLGCVILGGFYYASEINKQQSIEKQQRIDLQAKQAQQQSDMQAQQGQQQALIDQNNLIASQKADCVKQAQQTAISEYASSDSCIPRPGYVMGFIPAKDCKDGRTYLVPQYDNAYNTCLQSKGLK